MALRHQNMAQQGKIWAIFFNKIQWQNRSSNTSQNSYDNFGERKYNHTWTALIKQNHATPWTKSQTIR